MNYCLVFTLLFLISSTVHPDTQKPLKIVPVKTLSIPANHLLVSGSVAARKSVILAAQLPGRIVSISGEEDDHFKRGNLLVKINDDALRAKRKNAVAQFHKASIAVNNAGVQYHRRIVSRSSSTRAPGGMGFPGMFDQLFTNPVSDMMGIRDQDVERNADIFSTRAQLDQAHQALAQARAQINQIDTKLRDAMSIAPFDGVIVSKKVEVGDTVQPGQPLLVYENINVLQIVADIPERLVKSLQKDQQVNARIDGLSHKIKVKVSKVFPTSDPVRHTRRVKFSLPIISDISPGNYAEVWIPVAAGVTKKRFLIPYSAVVNRGGIPSIFVVNPKNQVELRLARIGNRLPSGEVVINYGVGENERVLDAPPAFVTSGYKIKQ